MKNQETINALRDVYGSVARSLRTQIIGSIHDAVKRLTGLDRLSLYEFHNEADIDDYTKVLVEVDRHSGDMGSETVDIIKIDSDDESFSVETENGYADSTYMSLDELFSLYDELSYIESSKDDPDWEFAIRDGEIVLKDDEEETEEETETTEGGLNAIKVMTNLIGKGREDSAKLDFLEKFDLQRSDDSLFAVSKQLYPHECPDGVVRNFRYFVIGRDTEWTQNTIKDKDGKAVEADSLELFVVPAKDSIPEDLFKKLHEEYFSDIPYEEFKRDADEALFMEYSYDYQAPSLFYIEYPYMGIHRPEGAFLDEDGYTVYWPKAILDELAGIVPLYDASFAEVMALSDHPAGITRWQNMQMCIQDKGISAFLSGELDWE